MCQIKVALSYFILIGIDFIFKNFPKAEKLRLYLKHILNKVKVQPKKRKVYNAK